MSEALEQFWVVFPSRNQSSEVMQPANCAFDFIVGNVASEHTTVLCGRLGMALAMRADQRDAARLAEPVGIGHFVVKQPLRRFVTHVRTSLIRQFLVRDPRKLPSSPKSRNSDSDAVIKYHARSSNIRLNYKINHSFSLSAEDVDLFASSRNQE